MDKPLSAGAAAGEGDEISALREELRALKDTIVDGLIIIDENKKVSSFNPGAERIFGYTAAEVIGRNAKMLMPDPYHSEHDAYVDNYRRSGEAKIIGLGREVTGRRKDGSTFPMYLSVGEMRSGKDRQFVGVVRDLSDLIEKQDLIEGIASNLPGPVFRRVQHTDGAISFTYVSAGLRRVFDLDPDAVTADPGYLIGAIHPDDLQGWRDAQKRALNSMEPHDYEMRVTGEDGVTRWMRAIAHPHRADNGDIVWDGLALDITAQKHAEAERTESARQYRELLDAAPDAIWISEASIIVYANPAAAHMFGAQDGADLIGRDNLRLVSSEDVAEISRRRANLRQGEQLAPVEIRRQRLNGDIIDTHTSAIGVHWNGRPANLMIARDITDSKKVDAQLRQVQKMEAIGQLTGGVAHDFNNLLAVLMMDLEQLSDLHTGGGEIGELLREAQDAVHSAADLTGRLLAFARQQDLQPERTDLQKLIAECLSLLRRTIGEHIELDTITAGDLWPVIVDPQQLENALLNLSVNARDAMPAGGRITIEAHNVSLDEDYIATIDGLDMGDYVHISVTDTGTGIPLNIQEKVFDPFFTTKEVGMGTGLGLSMVYGFAKQSGGHAAIDSEEGHGTVINLHIPRATSDDKAKPGGGIKPEANPSGDETILLVEDFPQLRKRGVQMLTKLGYTIIDAANGPEALDALEEAGRVDLLFTDLVMPGGMNGFDLAEMARVIQPDLKVLYTSGYAEGAEIDFGATDTSGLRLGKPYSRRDLAESVRRALDGDQESGEDSA